MSDDDDDPSKIKEMGTLVDIVPNVAIVPQSISVTGFTVSNTYIRE
jgi:hypothetical protein